MTERTRLIATGIVWTAYTIIIGVIAAALQNSELDLYGALIVLAIFIVLTAAVNNGTRAIWQRDAMDTSQQRGKLKRTRASRVERLIDGLDDDEIYELENALLSREEHDNHRASRT
jgi:hypothetical protein